MKDAIRLGPFMKDAIRLGPSIKDSSTYQVVAVLAVRVSLLGLGTAKQLDCLKDSIAMAFKQVEPFKTSLHVAQESLLNLDS